MNEQIRKLAEQARLGRGPEKIHIGENGVVIFYLDELEKFAELIVRECADVGSKFSMAHPEDISYQIKRHFGVEE